MTGIVHVGGWEGVEYLDFAGPLVIFEPQARAFAALQRNLGGRAGVTLVNAAAGAQEVPAVAMYQMSDDQHASLIEPVRMLPGFSRAGETTVPMVTVDSVMEGRYGFATLRLDTQGYELEVLKGSVRTLHALGRVEIELHDPTIYPDAATLRQLDEFMAGQGWIRTGLDTEHSHDIADATYEPAP